MLYLLATKFDDGHGLHGLRMDGSWYCSKLWLDEFGGYGKYLGKHFNYSMDSYGETNMAEQLDQALSDGDIQAPTESITRDVLFKLNSIADEAQRDAVRQRLIILMEDMLSNRGFQERKPPRPQP